MCAGWSRPFGFILRLATFTASSEVLGDHAPGSLERVKSEWVAQLQLRASSVLPHSFGGGAVL